MWKEIFEVFEIRGIAWGVKKGNESRRVLEVFMIFLQHVKSNSEQG